MSLKEIILNGLQLLSVPKCVCCSDILDLGDRALCKSCNFEYRLIKSRICSNCKKVYSECTCNNNYLSRNYINKLIKVFRYKPSSSPDEKIPSNQLIYKIKRGYRRDLVDFISDEVVTAIKTNLNYRGFVITNVPRSKSRTNKYGIDHSASISKAIAKKLKIKYVEIIESTAKYAQKKMLGEERFENATFVIKKNLKLKGKKVILFDGIVTTGASMRNCASLIKALGAKEIVGACISIAFMDRYKPFDSSDRFNVYK